MKIMDYGIIGQFYFLVLTLELLSTHKKDTKLEIAVKKVNSLAV
jgi:hypothetical protein